MQRLEHDSVHNETRLHVGDPRAVSLVAVDPERAFCRGSIGKHRVAMAHQHDRPAVAAAGKPSCHAIAIRGVGDGLADDAGSFETRPQPIPDGVDSALVVVPESMFTRSANSPTIASWRRPRYSRMRVFVSAAMARSERLTTTLYPGTADQAED